MSVNIDDQDSLRRPRKGVPMNLEYIGVPTNDYDNGRDEKPWQRVVYQMTRKGKHLYEPVKSLPSTFLVLVLAGFLLLGYLTQLVEDDMPAVIRDADVARDVHDTFSEEAAWGYLRDILGSEPRVSGTVYHLNKTRDMKAIVDAIALDANQAVLTDWQLVTGDYYLKSAAPFLNLYENASNVIAVLEGESGFHSNGTTGSSILINCHYDSVPFAMGASDNAVFCAVMAETLSRLSRRSRKFRHNIVFLFNGAEENGLQASHGFLKHRWAGGVRTVVNLDSAGMNGKPAVFQVTDPRVLNAYRRSVSRPNAQGMGEFLFSSGIIPSDTDFRIFRDFGGINGIDIAFSKWGHVYHTRNDRADLIQPGVVQNAGNMVLALLVELADMDELDTTIEATPSVYWDFLNVFTVTYSAAAAYGADAAALALAALSVGYYVWLAGPRMSTLKELVFAVLGRLVCVAAGLLLTTACSCIMIPTTIQLRYLSQPWLVVPIFWMPYLIGCVAASQAYDAWRTKKSGLNRSIRTLQAMAATRLALAITLVILMCVPALGSVRYAISAPLFIMSLMALVSLTAIRYFRLQAWQHLWLEIALCLPSTMLALTFALRIDAMMLPIMGRSPSSSPDVTVGLINAGLALLVSATVSGIELLFSRRRLWLPLSVVGAACFVLMFIPFSPYWDEGPSTMRHYWFHSEIVTFNENKVPIETTTGVVVYKVDANTVSHVVPDLAAAGLRLEGGPSPHCAERVYCDLPLYRTTFARSLPEALLLHTSGPAPFSPPADVDVSRSCVGETCTFTFVVTGTAHNTITIWPHEHVNLTAWSFDSPLAPAFLQRGRPVYVIVHSLATYAGATPPLQFTADFVVPLALQRQPTVQVSLHAHRIHHPEEFTPGYRRLLAAAPPHYNVASFLSFRHNYVF